MLWGSPVAGTDARCADEGAAHESDRVRWHVIHVKSRQENALSRDLVALGIDHYLPVRERTTYHGLQKLKVSRPLFSGYLFLRGTTEQAYTADRTRRVANLIWVADQHQLEWELRQIRFALECKAALDIWPHMVRGRDVEVRAGPFRGLQGTIHELTAADRLILGIHLLGQAVSLEIDTSLLEPVDRPANKPRRIMFEDPSKRTLQGCAIG